MQSETGFPSSHQLKSYVASKSRLKLAARAVLSADAGLLVVFEEKIAIFNDFYFRFERIERIYHINVLNQYIISYQYATNQIIARKSCIDDLLFSVCLSSERVDCIQFSWKLSMDTCNRAQCHSSINTNRNNKLVHILTQH